MGNAKNYAGIILCIVAIVLTVMVWMRRTPAPGASIMAIILTILIWCLTLWLIGTITKGNV